MINQNALIVENDSQTAGYIKRNLENLNFSVLKVCKSGKQAISLINRFHPDIILINVSLEGEMDGVSAIEEILKKLDVPVVYIASDSEKETIERLMKTEPHGFLIKPFDERILVSAVQIAAFRHKTRKELAQTKELLRSTIESIDDMVLGLTKQGIIRQVFPKPSYMFFDCFNPHKIIDKSIHEIFPKDIAQNMQQCIREVLQLNSVSKTEFSLEYKQNIYWFEASITVRKNDQQTIQGLTMVISDITNSKFTYQELLVSQEKLTEAQNIAGLGNCDIFFDENQYVYNDTFFSILGIKNPRERNAFNDEKMMEIIHPEDRMRYKNYYDRVLEEKIEDFEIDYRIKPADSEVKYIHAIAKVRYSDSGRPVRMIMTILDVTMQKNNEKLLQDVEMSRKTTDLKQKFFARLSHEIRNPVSGLVGMLQLLEKTELSENQKDYIEALKTTSHTLLNLVNDVLDYTKIDSGKMKVQNNELNIKATLKNLTLFFSGKTKDKDIKISYDFDPKIPSVIVSDQNKIIQILSNYLTNAMKFTEKGEIKVVANYHSELQEGFLLDLKVTDTGKGISQKDQKKLFRDFEQLDNQLTEDQKGTGLGLSICKHLVKLLGGDILFESIPGKGSTFGIRIPVIPSMSNKKETSADLNDANQQKDLNLSVLVVEDLQVNRKVIKIMLDQLGCKVDTASDGLEALKIYKETHIEAFNIFPQKHYDVIIMDQNMPNMSGADTARKIRDDYKNPPVIILLTADESLKNSKEITEGVFDDIILKPVKMESLYQLLHTWSETINSHQENNKLKIYSKEDIESKPVLNKHTIEMIIRNAEENKFNVENLFESFIEDMEITYKQILTSIEMEDINALAMAILTIKGLTGNIGASQLHATAKLIDRIIRNEEYEKAKNMIPFLAEKYAIFKNEIEIQYFEKHIINDDS